MKRVEPLWRCRSYYARYIFFSARPVYFRGFIILCAFITKTITRLTFIFPFESGSVAVRSVGNAIPRPIYHSHFFKTHSRRYRLILKSDISCTRHHAVYRTRDSIFCNVEGSRNIHVLSSRNNRMLRYNADRFVYYLPTFLLMQLRYPTNIRRTPVIRVLSKGWHSTPARLCRRVYNYRGVHRDDVGVSNGHLPLSAGSQAILTALSCLIILRTHSTP